MNTNKSFAELLLYYRSKEGLSQEELAQKSGVSKVQIAKYETNKSNPRLKAIMKLAEALNISVGDLGYDGHKVSKKEFTTTIDNEHFEKLQEIAKAEGKTVEQLYSEVLAEAINEIISSESFKEYSKDLDLKITKVHSKEIDIEVTPKK